VLSLSLSRKPPRLGIKCSARRTEYLIPARGGLLETTAPVSARAHIFVSANQCDPIFGFFRLCARMMSGGRPAACARV
jgi:hypothetical protein